MLITCLSLVLLALCRRRSPRRSRGLSPQRTSIEAFAPHKAVASPSRVKEEGGAEQRDKITNYDLRFFNSGQRCVQKLADRALPKPTKPTVECLLKSG